MFSENIGPSIDIVQLFVDYGADVTLSTYDGDSPLHEACTFSSLVKGTNVKVIKLCLDNGADLNTPAEDGSPPLLDALRELSLEKFKQKNMKKTITFLLEYTNVNVINAKGNHVLAVDSNSNLPTTVWKIIVQHLARLQSSGIILNPAILSTISNKDDYNKYYEQCKAELSLAKDTKLTNCWVTFFNILMDSRKKLKNYSGNLDLIEDFKKSECVKKFPIYGAIMQEKVKNGRKRRELFDKSSIFLSECLPIFNSSHLVIRDALDCITSKKDLFKLCH